MCPDHPSPRRPPASGPSKPAIDYDTASCHLGQVLVAEGANGVVAVLLGEDAESLIEDLQRRFTGRVLQHNPARLQPALTQVRDIIEEPNTPCKLALDLHGTAFQQRVWLALQQIPAGSTTSYSEIARAINQPLAVRAVASACGANNLAILIPCHRVLRQDGGLSGYRWGVARKRLLLEQERGIKSPH